MLDDESLYKCLKLISSFTIFHNFLIKRTSMVFVHIRTLKLYNVSISVAKSISSKNAGNKGLLNLRMLPRRLLTSSFIAKKSNFTNLEFYLSEDHYLCLVASTIEIRK